MGEFCNFSVYQKTLKELLIGIEKENNPLYFRDKLMAIIQLYFDGIIDRDLSDEEFWPLQSATLDKLFLAGKTAIGTFYRNEGINFDKIKEILLPSASDIILFGDNENKAKYRHLESQYDNLQKMGLEFQNILENRRFIRPDSLVCIASGAFEPSFLIMDILDIKELTPIRYSRCCKKDKEVLVPKNAPKDYVSSKIKNKHVLVIEDWINGGQTLEKVIMHILEIGPGVVSGIAPVVQIKGENKLPNLDVCFLNKYEPFLCTNCSFFMR